MKHKWLMFSLLPLLALMELISGRAQISVVQAISDLLVGNNSVASIILWEVRLPRLWLAMLCGGALASSGAALQGLLRNPLASPDLLGISQTAALGAVIALYFGFSLQAWFVLPLAALGGATLAVMILLRLTQHVSGTGGLILAGIAVSALAGSLTTFTLTFAPNPYALQDAYFWLLGSIGNRSDDDVWLALPFMAVGTALLLSCSRCLDALSLGEDTAAALGFPLGKYRWRLIVGVACNIGAAVAVSGSIGFVGLMVPHLLRSLCSAQPSQLLRWSLPGGAILVLLADVIVQQLPASQELPLGVLTALLGGPFFLLLIMKQRRQM